MTAVSFFRSIVVVAVALDANDLADAAGGNRHLASGSCCCCCHCIESESKRRRLCTPLLVFLASLLNNSLRNSPAMTLKR